MKRNLLKITTLLLVILAITFTMTTPVFAGEATQTSKSIAGEEGFNVSFNVSDSTNAGNVVANVVGNILYIAQVIGMGVATIMLLVLAIIYYSVLADY